MERGIDGKRGRGMGKRDRQGVIGKRDRWKKRGTRDRWREREREGK